MFESADALEEIDAGKVDPAEAKAARIGDTLSTDGQFFECHTPRTRVWFTEFRSAISA